MAEKQEKKVEQITIRSVARKPQVFNLKVQEGEKPKAIHLMPGKEATVKVDEITFEINNALERGDIIKK